MLLDLLYSALPSRKKRRWHFSTFMLDIYRRIEQERVMRSRIFGIEQEHVIMSLARDAVATNPILFLDEFQMPDRVSSKLLNGFMTSFFHLGGVLVASSNRMPDELAKASGIEFGNMQSQGRGRWGWGGHDSIGQRTARSDVGAFLEVLKTRCEVWEMEGNKDWRREDLENAAAIEEIDDMLSDEEIESSATSETSLSSTGSSPEMLSSDAPPHYHISVPDTTSNSFESELRALNPSKDWIPTTLSIYARPVTLPTTFDGILVGSFTQLCAANLGPADYTSLTSNFHTFVLTSVPVLNLLQKNEARRFITLLDALYESKCRLLVEAEAPPDKLFFPETRVRSVESKNRLPDDDSIQSESFSEMYQDSTAPFRPNVSVYAEGSDSSATPTTSLRRPDLRSVLADEDADFGPTYGNGRSHGASTASSADELRIMEERQNAAQAIGPDFTNVGIFTGEDERFAYKRARSRLWEMCGRRWWNERKGGPEEWWRPIGRDGRFWEKHAADLDALVATEVFEKDGLKEEAMPDSSHDGRRRKTDPSVRMEERDHEGLFKHGASPYRVSEEAPPRFGWEHAWGMVKWGKRGERKRRRKSDEAAAETSGPREPAPGKRS